MRGSRLEYRARKPEKGVTGTELKPRQMLSARRVPPKVHLQCRGKQQQTPYTHTRLRWPPTEVLVLGASIQDLELGLGLPLELGVELE